MKIIQIATGVYSFGDYNEVEEKEFQGFSHVVYGLGDDGVIYKQNPKSKEWVDMQITRRD